MKRALFILHISIAFSSCSKDTPSSEPYSERIIYIESFETNPNWTLLPNDTFYRPDTTCIKVEDGILKMSFDQPLKNCGCAWIGINYSQQQLLENSSLDKVGIRVRLNEGFFQNIETYYDTVDVYGYPCQIGAIISSSTFSLNFNCLDIRFPSTRYGRFPRGSIIDFNAYKLTGNEFEIIYDNGKKSFLIDGVEQSLDNIVFHQNKFSIHPLSIDIQLGHLPELSPRLDKLFVDEIEIYTWTGDK